VIADVRPDVRETAIFAQISRKNLLAKGTAQAI